ncbi:hypothetical protein KIN20_025135 [Parelaphostrongylus tenuis]|uniref:Uncharacterized protein n=1 Tax=Parelaphostrongylus tenuis TaxID=148309 RepID=A0AAD5MZ44_PARTN|nr:hypothetical protein KIN20_025135 [Parelaphostrongylus tenuis]
MARLYEAFCKQDVTLASDKDYEYAKRRVCLTTKGDLSNVRSDHLMETTLAQVSGCARLNFTSKMVQTSLLSLQNCWSDLLEKLQSQDSAPHSVKGHESLSMRDLCLVGRDGKWSMSSGSGHEN